MRREEYLAKASQGFLYLDGATGSNLFLAGMPRGMHTEQWVLDHREVVIGLQREYLEAGSQMVCAPTFSANRFSLAGTGMEREIEDLNKRLVSISQDAVGGRAWIIGDMAPTGRVLESRGGDTSVDELFDVYFQQASALIEAGVDLIGIETMMSLEETMVALDAAMAAGDLAVTCTMSVEADGNALYDGSAVEAMETLQAMGAAAVGLNCSVGPDQLECVVRNMKEVAEVPVIAKPNAGLPFIDETGKAIYSMGPVEFARYMKTLVDAGASVIGGCCGTNPEYIRKTRLALEGKLIL